MTSLAAVPDAVSKTILIALAIVLTYATYVTAAPGRWGWISVFMQAGMIGLFAGTDLGVMGEPWSGVIIGLSLCAFVSGWRWTAIALGLIALFLRELAGPYCVACTVMAVWNRRWREVAAWLGGACAYALYYWRHVTHVVALRLPDDIAHATSWLEFGGLVALVGKVHWQGWLVLLPIGFSIAALLVLITGAVWSRTNVMVRVATATYLIFFCLAGKPFDWYWGLIAWPVWAQGFGGGVEAIRMLVATATSTDGNRAA
jgi:hypothetical protein